MMMRSTGVLTLVLAHPMGMMMGQLQHAQGRVWKLMAIHETQNVKVVIFCHNSSRADYFQVTKRH